MKQFLLNYISLDRIIFDNEFLKNEFDWNIQYFTTLFDTIKNEFIENVFSDNSDSIIPDTEVIKQGSAPARRVCKGKPLLKDGKRETVISIKESFKNRCNAMVYVYKSAIRMYALKKLYELDCLDTNSPNCQIKDEKVNKEVFTIYQNYVKGNMEGITTKCPNIDLITKKNTIQYAEDESFTSYLQSLQDDSSSVDQIDVSQCKDYYYFNTPEELYVLERYMDKIAKGLYNDAYKFWQDKTNELITEQYNKLHSIYQDFHKIELHKEKDATAKIQTFCKFIEQNHGKDFYKTFYLIIQRLTNFNEYNKDAVRLYLKFYHNNKSMNYGDLQAKYFIYLYIKMYPKRDRKQIRDEANKISKIINDGDKKIRDDIEQIKNEIIEKREVYDKEIEDFEQQKEREELIKLISEKLVAKYEQNE